jgi:uncharacterized protein
MAHDEQEDVLEFLGNCEPGIKLVDTHASIIFLGKDRSLKVKQAIKLPFLDYSTCEKRQHACSEELRVNQAFAPDLHRRILPVTRSHSHLEIEGDGAPVERMVEMVRFDEQRGLDRIAKTTSVGSEIAIAISEEIQLSHSRAIPATEAAWPGSIKDIIARNTTKFRSVGLLAADFDRLDTEGRAALATYEPTLKARKQAGFVRRCHGDLHLGNIVLINDRPTLFDAIEFDPEVATTDLLYDVAFTLDTSLLPTQPIITLLSLLPLFMSIRAAIRAFVFFTRGEEPGSDPARYRAEGMRYFNLAMQFLRPEPAMMVAIGGTSGTGKSALSRKLTPLVGSAPGALVLRA